MAVTPKFPEKHYLNQTYGIRSWLLTTDHKRIALLYLVSVTFFFFVGGFFAMMIRLHLLTPDGYLLSADTYNKMFTMHGVAMIFFFLIPSIPAIFGNFLIPLMIGAKDLAFPKINLLSWYIYIVGGSLTLYAMVTGGLDTGWTFYTPLSTVYSNSAVAPAVVGIFITGFSSILTGLNFLVTVHTMRAPGMTWFRLPLFVWAHYATSVVMILGTPVVAITLALAFYSDAPLKELANPAIPENPAKAPWYFLGLQELVSYSAFMGGLLIPVIVLVGLALIPFLDRRAGGEGVWFGTKGEKGVFWQSLVFAIAITVGILAFTVNFGWLRSWFPKIHQLWIIAINPGSLLVVVFAAWSLWVLRRRNSVRLAAVSLFTCFLVGFTLLTYFATVHRGPNWHFYWWPSQWPLH